MVEGIIKFTGFKVEKIIYELKSIGFESKENNISPDFMIYLVEKDTNTISRNVDLFNILFGVRVGFNDNEEIPFSSEVILRGFYEFNYENALDYDILNKHKFFLINGCAILFPYLRSVLTDVTSKSDHNPVILPTINFQKFIDKKDVEKLVLDHIKYSDYK